MDNSGVFIPGKSSPGGYFGDGKDGDLVMLGDVTLPAGTYYKSYRNVNMNGHTLTSNDANEFMCIRVSGNLDFGNGGTIRAGINQNQPTRPAKGSGLDGGGDGGAGGRVRNNVIVYAKGWSGTGSVNSDGENGNDASNGGTPTGNTDGGPGANALNISSWLGKGNALSSLNGTAGLVGRAGLGGTSNSGGAVAGTAGLNGIPALYIQLLMDPARFLSPTQDFTQLTDFVFANHLWVTFGAAGGGGGGGGALTSPGFTGAGGGGAAGGAFIGKGGDGGTGGGQNGFILGGNPANSSGGAGGGGGSGALTIFVTGGGSGTLTVSANGGAGGKGGNPHAISHGGGGGGGGGGGRVIYMGPTGPTVTASGGAGGAAGADTAGDGAPCGPGSAGGDGLVDQLLLSI